MVDKDAKKIIDFLSLKWGLPHRDRLFHVVDRLEGGLLRQGSGFNGYEFSFIPGVEALRFLHLEFYREKMSDVLRRNTARARHGAVLSVLEYINNELGADIDIKKADELIKIFRDTRIPLHIALKIKKDNCIASLYFSTVVSGPAEPRHKAFISRKLEEVCVALGGEWKDTKKKFNGFDFNVIGVDFRRAGKTGLKIYTYRDNPLSADFVELYNTYLRETGNYGLCGPDIPSVNAYFRLISHLPVKQSGLLYRISGEAVNSLKLWVRFKRRFSFRELSGGLKGHLDFSRQYERLVSQVCDLSNGGIIYFTFENGKPNIYVR